MTCNISVTTPGGRIRYTGIFASTGAAVLDAIRRFGVRARIMAEAAHEL